VIEKSK
jgi:Sperm-tail PG-rich repeat